MRVPRLLIGAAAGGLATVPMTVVMTLLYPLLPRGERYPLPPSQITAKATQEAGIQPHLDTDQHRALTLFLHSGFGAASGAFYAPLAHRLRVPPVIGGIGYGLIVWLGSYLGWVPALGVLPKATDEPRWRNVLMIVAHMVWGLALALLSEHFGAGPE